MTPEPMPTRQKYEHALRFTSRIVLKNKIKELVKWIHRAEVGYDIGAGLGQYTKALKAMGYVVVPVEPLHDYYFYAVNLKAEDLQEKHDYAYLLNVLHHSDDPVNMLRHLKTLCPKIIISELNRHNPFVKLFVKIFLPWEHIDGHLNRKEVETIIKKSGLRITHSYQSSLLGVPRVYNWFICGHENQKEMK
jgi:hypothetical protein